MLGSIFVNRKTIGVVLIDTYSSSAFYYAWLSARLCSILGVKYITILRGGNLPDRINNSPGLSRQLFAHAVTNIVISGYLQKCLEEKGFKNHLINNNINLALYPFQLRTKATPRLLWVRAFHEATYNPQLAVRIVARLAGKYPDVHLAMVGPDKDGSMETCKKLSADLGIADKITFTGRLSKADWTALSTGYGIFVNTTNFDNLPISVIEALALGMPVVTTNVGGIPYLVRNEENGLLVNPRSEDEMIAAITRLLQDDKITERLSRNARQTADSYDWQIIRKQWHALLDPHL